MQRKNTKGFQKRGGKIAFEGTTIKLTANFSTAKTETCKQVTNIFSVVKDNNCQFRILYKMKLSFTDEGKSKDISRNEVERVCHQSCFSKGNTKGGTLG